MILFNSRKMGIDPTGPAGTVLAGYDKAMKDAEEEYVACHYLRHLNVKRHGSLLTHLQNQFTLGTDKYPKTLTVAYNLSIKWKQSKRRRQKKRKQRKLLQLLPPLTHQQSVLNQRSVLNQWRSL